MHHPVDPGLYYEDQKPEALRRADAFRTARLPKFLTHFEAVLRANHTGAGVLVGTAVSTADLALYHVLHGLTHAYPRRVGALRAAGAHPKVFALKDKLDRELAAYLASDRRCEYSKGVFRHYPELVSPRSPLSEPAR